MTLTIDPAFVALILALLAQAGGFVWGASRLASSVRELRGRMDGHDSRSEARDEMLGEMRERMARLESRVEGALDRLDELLERQGPRPRQNGRRTARH